MALGAGDQEKPFTKSTLRLLRAHLLLHEKARVAFERSLAVAKKSGYLRSHCPLRAAIDNTYILGQEAVRDTYNLIGDRIVSVAQPARMLRGWTQRELARNVHVDPGTLSDLLAERRHPTFGTVHAICASLNLALAEVIAFHTARRPG